MFAVEICETTENSEALADVLRHVADAIDEGYTSGVSPSWALQGTDTEEV